MGGRSGLLTPLCWCSSHTVPLFVMDAVSGLRCAGPITTLHHSADQRSAVTPILVGYSRAPRYSALSVPRSCPITLVVGSCFRPPPRGDEIPCWFGSLTLGRACLSLIRSCVCVMEGFSFGAVYVGFAHQPLWRALPLHERCQGTWGASSVCRSGPCAVLGSRVSPRCLLVLRVPAPGCCRTASLVCPGLAAQSVGL